MFDETADVKPRGAYSLSKFAAEQSLRSLADAGFAIEDSLERDPYAPHVEYQSRRAYILESKPR